MASLERFVHVRPALSNAAPTWFNLGDQDLATHFYRTARLAEGATLTEVTAEITAAFGLPQRLVPMSDQRVTTMVSLADEHVEVPFQEYFVQRQHSVPVSAVRFDGAERTSPAPGVLEAIADADVVIIAPSNPLVSIAPVLAVPGIREALIARRETVVAVSPIVAGAALKGPADRMLSELGHEASVVGVARLCRDFAATLVIDTLDSTRAVEVEEQGMRCVVTETIMSRPGVSESLARIVLAGAVA